MCRDIFRYKNCCVMIVMFFALNENTKIFKERDFKEGLVLSSLIVFLILLICRLHLLVILPLPFLLLFCRIFLYFASSSSYTVTLYHLPLILLTYNPIFLPPLLTSLRIFRNFHILFCIFSLLFWIFAFYFGLLLPIILLCTLSLLPYPLIMLLPPHIMFRSNRPTFYFSH